MYFVTYQPSSQVERLVRAVNTVNTTDSRMVIDDLDPTTEYTFTVDVGTAGGKLRGTLGAGQCMLLECMDFTWQMPLYITCGPTLCDEFVLLIIRDAEEVCPCSLISVDHMSSGQWDLSGQVA